jgi:hypothetical protein
MMRRRRHAFFPYSMEIPSMSAYTRAPLVLLGLLVLSSFGQPTFLVGQEQRQSPVFLAIPETFPDIDARALVMREPGRDVVILDQEDTDPAESLRVALMVLRRMRRDHPMEDGRGQLIPITGYAVRRAMEPARRSRIEEALNQLRRRPLANVGNLGPGRWIRLRADL